MSTGNFRLISMLTIVIFLLAGSAFMNTAYSEEAAVVAMDADGVTINVASESLTNFSQMIVRVMDPGGNLVINEVNDTGIFNWDVYGLPDGAYNWEVLVINADGDEAGHESGEVIVEDGQLVIPENADLEPADQDGQPIGLLEGVGNAVAGIMNQLLEAVTPSAHAQTVVTGPAPYIWFDDTQDEDTTSSADWMLQADGGENDADTHNWLRIYDFENEGGAPSPAIIDIQSWGSSDRSLEVESDGDIKLANGAYFFSRNPYHFGVGTTTPEKRLHLYGSHSVSLSNNRICARIENTTPTVGSRHMLQLVNRGNPLLWFHNTQNDIRWSMNPIDTSFVFSRGGSGGYEMQLDSNGNLVIRGSLTQNSDRNMKKNIEAVNPVQVLETVAALPISSWQFKHDTEKSRHLGPMAQDFYAAFGLGRDEKGIAPGDVSGVALAAIKGLNTVVQDKDAKIVQLEGKVADLEKKLQAQQAQLARLSALEPVVAKLIHQLNAQGTMKVSFETSPAENHSF